MSNRLAICRSRLFYRIIVLRHKRRSRSAHYEGHTGAACNDQSLGITFIQTSWSKLSIALSECFTSPYFFLWDRLVQVINHDYIQLMCCSGSWQSLIYKEHGPFLDLRALIITMGVNQAEPNVWDELSAAHDAGPWQPFEYRWSIFEDTRFTGELGMVT